MKIITDEERVKKTVETFRAYITDHFDGPTNKEYAFPHGARVSLNAYSIDTQLGTLEVAVADNWNERIPHLLTLNAPNGVYSPSVELNIPLRYNRRVSGVYIYNENDIWLCSRGIFTSYRGGIPKQKTFTFFRQWLIEVDDNKQRERVIPVAALSSKTLHEEMALFVTHVLQLKETYKSSPDIIEQEYGWHDNDEIEGNIAIKKAAKQIEYEYLHGPLCNALRKYLKEAVKEKTDSVVFSNRQVDVALVNTHTNKAVAIFEVKTSYSFSQQLFKAIGQLQYYREIYGTPKTQLYLILPDGYFNELKDVTTILTNVGIHVFKKSQDGFVNLSKNSLKNVCRAIVEQE